MPSSQLYMIHRKAVPKLARRRAVASTWHDIIKGILTLRYPWPETSCDMKIWRLCPLTKLYIMSGCNEWSAGSPPIKSRTGPHENEVIEPKWTKNHHHEESLILPKPGTSTKDIETSMHYEIHSVKQLGTSKQMGGMHMFSFLPSSGKASKSRIAKHPQGRNPNLRTFAGFCARFAGFCARFAGQFFHHCLIYI